MKQRNRTIKVKTSYKENTFVVSKAEVLQGNRFLIRFNPADHNYYLRFADGKLWHLIAAEKLDNGYRLTIESLEKTLLPAMAGIGDFIHG